MCIFGVPEVYMHASSLLEIAQLLSFKPAIPEHAAVRNLTMILRSAMDLSLALIPLSDNFPLKVQVGLFQ